MHDARNFTCLEMHDKFLFVPNIEYEFVISTAAVSWLILAFIERLRHYAIHMDIHSEVTFLKLLLVRRAGEHYLEHDLLKIESSLLQRNLCH